MAGNSKPNIPNLGKEASYQVLSLVGSQGSGGTVQLPGLFDGNNPNEWNTDKVMYWQTADHFIEINISSPKVNIWRSGTTDWKSYINSLKIKYWNGSLYVDVTANYPQTVTQITEKQWEKTISNLPSGRYRFEYGTERRLDSEWFIETSPSNKILLSSGDKHYSFTNRKYKNIIPAMISNTSTYPIVPIFSSEWTNGIQAGAGSAFNAFDGDINKVSGWSSATNAFIGIDWGTAKLIEGYRITSHSTITNTPPTEWIFEASQDNSTWVTLDTRKGISWGKGEVKEFIISNTSYYRYYRLRCTVNATFAVAELEMLKLSSPAIVAYDAINENTLVKFSESSISDFNFKINEIKDIKFNNTSLNSGKTFEHTIDMSKRRVDKITLG